MEKIEKILKVKTYSHYSLDICEYSGSATFNSKEWSKATAYDSLFKDVIEWFYGFVIEENESTGEGYIEISELNAGKVLTIEDPNSGLRYTLERCAEENEFLLKGGDKYTAHYISFEIVEDSSIEKLRKELNKKSKEELIEELISLKA